VLITDPVVRQEIQHLKLIRQINLEYIFQEFYFVLPASVRHDAQCSY